MPAPWARGARLRIIGRIHGQQTVNVLHFATNDVVQDGPPLDQLLLQLAQAMLACVVDTLLPAVSQDWSVDRVEAQAIHPAPSDPVVSTANANSVGQRGTTNVSFASAMAHIRTGTGGKSGRGRIFLPPCGDADMVNSGIDDATLLLITQFLVCVATKFAGANPTTPWRIGVLSRKQLAAAGGSFNNAFREATQLTAEKNVAVMSSRKVGKGS